MKRLTNLYQILIITISVLAMYYPTNFAEICLIDDFGAISEFLSQESFSLKDIFFPHSSSGGYYRPLIALSYILDKQLWFLHERLMHFESVVAHLVNGVLLFYVCREAVYLHLRMRETYLPLGAAMLFSLHPIMTESVNWISGRTDVMMTTFVLVSMLSLLRYIQSRSKLLLAEAIIFGLIACLAKETAFGYLIGMPLFTLYRVDSDCQQDVHFTPVTVRLYVIYYMIAFFSALLIGSYWLVLGIAVLYLGHLTFKKYRYENSAFSISKIIALAVALLAVGATVGGLFVFIRRMAFTSDVSKIGQTITLMSADLNYSISLFLGAVGFYVKKFFYPLPLNFFILEIDPLYDFGGIAVLLIFCHLVLSRKLPTLLAIMGLLVLLPALPLAFSTIAWTAYAERYIYLSSAFWIIAICLWGGTWLEKNPTRKNLVTALVVLLCFASAGVTFWRNIIWQSNVTLLHDTVAQTPRIRKLRNIYIKALIDNGETNEALKQYRLAAEEVPSSVGDEQAALMVSRKLISERRNDDALQLYQDALMRTQYKSEPLMCATVNLLRSIQTVGTVSEQERERLAKLLKKYSDLLEGIKQKKVTSSSFSSSGL